jgi:hypothetical protein
LSASIIRCPDVALLHEPKLNGALASFAICRYWVRLMAGCEALTTRAAGKKPSGAMATKSFLGSYGAFFIALGAMVCDSMPP